MLNHSDVDTGITWSRINYRNELYKLWEGGKPGQGVLTHGQGVTQTRARCAKRPEIKEMKGDSNE